MEKSRKKSEILWQKNQNLYEQKLSKISKQIVENFMKKNQYQIIIGKKTVRIFDKTFYGSSLFDDRSICSYFVVSIEHQNYILFFLFFSSKTVPSIGSWDHSQVYI